MSAACRGHAKNMEMKEVDELGVARTQKDTNGVEVDFPLRKFSLSTGWTSDFVARATPADLAQRTLRRSNRVPYAIPSRNDRRDLW